VKESSHAFMGLEHSQNLRMLNFEKSHEREITIKEPLVARLECLSMITMYTWPSKINLLIIKV
jgi:hypothetical protein